MHVSHVHMLHYYKPTFICNDSILQFASLQQLIFVTEALTVQNGKYFEMRHYCLAAINIHYNEVLKTQQNFLGHE